MAEEFVQVFTAQGMLDAETYRLFLQSFGIESILIQESAGLVYGLTVGTLGEVKIMVPESLAPRAVELLEKMQQGVLESNEDYTPPDPHSDPLP